MLVEMMNYTQWADEKMISVFDQQSVVPENASSLFSHVLNAQYIWACRILAKEPQFQVWEVHQPHTYSQISKTNFELLDQILKTIDLGSKITYTNSRGERYTDVVKDILLHVFNHSTYHRGQIASMLKINAIQPPATDYIQLKREIHL